MLSAGSANAFDSKTLCCRCARRSADRERMRFLEPLLYVRVGHRDDGVRESARRQRPRRALRRSPVGGDRRHPRQPGVPRIPEPGRRLLASSTPRGGASRATPATSPSRTRTTWFTSLSAGASRRRWPPSPPQLAALKRTTSVAHVHRAPADRGSARATAIKVSVHDQDRAEPGDGQARDADGRPLRARAQRAARGRGPGHPGRSRQRRCVPDDDPQLHLAMKSREPVAGTRAPTPRSSTGRRSSSTTCSRSTARGRSRRSRCGASSCACSAASWSPCSDRPGAARARCWRWPRRSTSRRRARCGWASARSSGSTTTSSRPTAPAR